MPPTVSKLKGKTFFQSHYTCSHRLFPVFLPSCPLHLPFSSYCDIAQSNHISCTNYILEYNIPRQRVPL